MSSTPTLPAPVSQPSPAAPAMSASRFDWKLILTLAFSSLMGSALTLGVQEWRAKIPAIHCSIETSQMFSGAGSKLNASVAVTEDGKTFQFSNLSLVIIKIANNTRLDYKQFPFSVAMPEGSEIIQSEVTTKGPSHLVSRHADPSPHQPLSRLDFIAKPFNRTEEFTVTLYVQSLPYRDSIKVDSPESIKWASLEDDANKSWFAPGNIAFAFLALLVVIASIGSSYAKHKEKVMKERREAERANQTNKLIKELIESYKNRDQAPDASSAGVEPS